MTATKTRICPLTNQMFTVVLPEVTGEKPLETPGLDRQKSKGKLRKPVRIIQKLTEMSLCPSLDMRGNEELVSLTGKFRRNWRHLTRSHSACGNRIYKGVSGSVRRCQSPVELGNCCLTTSGVEVGGRKVRMGTARRGRQGVIRRLGTVGMEGGAKIPLELEISVNCPVDLGKLVHTKFVKQSQLVSLFKYHSRRFRS